jgi:hypothetical protein
MCGGACPGVGATMLTRRVELGTASAPITKRRLIRLTHLPPPPPAVAELLTAKNEPPLAHCDTTNNILSRHLFDTFKTEYLKDWP